MVKVTEFITTWRLQHDSNDPGFPHAKLLIHFLLDSSSHFRDLLRFHSSWYFQAWHGQNRRDAARQSGPWEHQTSLHQKIRFYPCFLGIEKFGYPARLSRTRNISFRLQKQVSAYYEKRWIVFSPCLLAWELVDLFFPMAKSKRTPSLSFSRQYHPSDLEWGKRPSWTRWAPADPKAWQNITTRTRGDYSENDGQRRKWVPPECWPSEGAHMPHAWWHAFTIKTRPGKKETSHEKEGIKSQPASEASAYTSSQGDRPCFPSNPAHVFTRCCSNTSVLAVQCSTQA